MIWFTSDQHFNHKNIIKYCKRPFKSLEEMEDTIINNFNKVVKANDTVWHLGDFTFSRTPGLWLEKLNGKEHNLILGNHDHRDIDGLTEIFNSVQEVKLLSVNNTRVFLSHYAHLIWPNRHYGTYHLFGHSHGTVNGVSGSLDVGVDAQNFTPLSINDIHKLIN